MNRKQVLKIFPGVQGCEIPRLVFNYSTGGCVIVKSNMMRRRLSGFNFIMVFMETRQFSFKTP